MNAPAFDPAWLDPPVPFDDVKPLIGPITVRVDDVSDASLFPEIAAAIQHARSLRTPANGGDQRAER